MEMTPPRASNLAGSERDMATDRETFLALLDRHGAVAMGMLRRLCGNGHDADDAFQDVAVRVWKHLGKRPWLRNDRAWLLTITYRAYLDQQARRPPSHVSLFDDDEALTSSATDRDPVAVAERAESAALVESGGGRAFAAAPGGRGAALYGRTHVAAGRRGDGDLDRDRQEPAQCRAGTTAEAYDMSNRCKESWPRWPPGDRSAAGGRCGTPPAALAVPRPGTSCGRSPEALAEVAPLTAAQRRLWAAAAADELTAEPSLDLGG